MNIFKAWVLSILAVIAVTALCCWLTGNECGIPLVLPFVVFFYMLFSLFIIVLL